MVLRELDNTDTIVIHKNRLKTASSIKRYGNNYADRSPRIDHPSPKVSKRLPQIQYRAERCDSRESIESTDSRISQQSIHSALSSRRESTRYSDLQATEEYAIQWVDDEEVTLCMCCQKVEFTFYRRKHHCRACGNVVCGDCSRARVNIQGLYGLHRICEECNYNFMQEKGRNSIKSNYNLCPSEPISDRPRRTRSKSTHGAKTDRIRKHRAISGFELSKSHDMYEINEPNVDNQLNHLVNAVLARTPETSIDDAQTLGKIKGVKKHETELNRMIEAIERAAPSKASTPAGVCVDSFVSTTDSDVSHTSTIDRTKKLHGHQDSDIFDQGCTCPIL